MCAPMTTLSCGSREVLSCSAPPLVSQVREMFTHTYSRSAPQHSTLSHDRHSPFTHLVAGQPRQPQRPQHGTSGSLRENHRHRLRRPQPAPPPVRAACDEEGTRSGKSSGVGNSDTAAVRVSRQHSRIATPSSPLLCPSASRTDRPSRRVQGGGRWVGFTRHRRPPRAVRSRV